MVNEVHGGGMGLANIAVLDSREHDEPQEERVQDLCFDDAPTPDAGARAADAGGDEADASAAPASSSGFNEAKRP